MKSSFNFIATVYDGVFVVERNVDSRVSVWVYVLCVSVSVCVRS